MRGGRARRLGHRASVRGRGAPTLTSASTSASSGESLARIERVAHRLADEDQQREHDGDDKEAGDAEPRRFEVALALKQELAERGRSGRQAKPEEVEGGQRRDRARELEGQERQRRHHGVRQQVLAHDGDVGEAEGARRRDVLEVAPAQEFGAHEADERRPAEEQEHDQKRPEAGHQHRGDDQEHVELGNRRPDLEEALEEEVDAAAEVALHGAGRDADGRASKVRSRPNRSEMRKP